MAFKGGTDAFTLNIIHNALVSASEEMFTVTARTAKSPIIYDVLDFSAAITDPEGNVTAQAVPGVRWRAGFHCQGGAEELREERPAAWRCHYS
jgi:N-methylhydantoinase B/oxoprolinase/acetone carboxylase alpha subunit